MVLQEPERCRALMVEASRERADACEISGGSWRLRLHPLDASGGGGVTAAVLREAARRFAFPGPALRG